MVRESAMQAQGERDQAISAMKDAVLERDKNILVLLNDNRDTEAQNAELSPREEMERLSTCTLQSEILREGGVYSSTFQGSGGREARAGRECPVGERT